MQSATLGRGVALGLAFSPQPPIATVLAALSIAGAAGLASFTIWDHLVDFAPGTSGQRLSPELGSPSSPHENLEYQTLLGYLAWKAGEVRIGVGVTEPIRRHPVVIAQAALSLSHLTKTRPILGVGAGEKANTVPYGLADIRPVARLEEALEIIRSCLHTAGPQDFHGNTFSLSNAHMDLAAGAGGVPEIWVGGRGPRMRRLAGEFGDGWYPADLADPARYEISLADVRAHAGRAGRDPDDILPAVELAVVFGESGSAAREALKDPGVRLLGLLAPAAEWVRFGGSHPLGEEYRGFVDFDPFALDDDFLRDALESVPPELIEEIVLWGTPELVAARIRSLGDAGLRHAVVSLTAEDVVKRGKWTTRALGETARILRK